MEAMRYRFGSATHSRRRAAVGGARRGGGEQRRRQLGHREVEDAPEVEGGWDAGLKEFFEQK
jgi:hypothetical protein